MQEWECSTRLVMILSRKTYWLVEQSASVARSWLISNYDFISETVANCSRDLWRVNKKSRSLRPQSFCRQIKRWLLLNSTTALVGRRFCWFFKSVASWNMWRCSLSPHLNWVINVCCRLNIKMLKVMEHNYNQLRLTDPHSTINHSIRKCSSNLGRLVDDGLKVS